MIWNENGLLLILGDSSYQVSHLMMLIVLGIALLMVVSAFVYFELFASRKVGRCRWHRTSSDRQSPFIKWSCKTCGEEAFSTDGRPPKECKRGLKSGV